MMSKTGDRSFDFIAALSVTAGVAVIAPSVAAMVINILVVAIEVF